MRKPHGMRSLVAGIVAFMCSTFAGTADNLVKLSIRHDGRDVAAPDHLTIIVDGDGIDVPIVGGTFTVPTSAAHADRADVVIVLAGEEIRVPKLRPDKFRAGDWTLLLADRRYDGGYQSEFPARAKIRRSCIFRFDSPEVEPTIVVVDNCRSKAK